MRPLSGISVLDLTSTLAGPYATQLLGALGATVIKVERPSEGDNGRQIGAKVWRDESLMYVSANSNKRSIAVDLKSDEGREVILRIASQCQVVVENMRPGVVDRLGIGFEDIRAVRKNVIYCSISGFGSKGPLSLQPGYDPLVQAYTGIMSITGWPDGRPVRTGPSIIDIGAGMWAVIGILSAVLDLSDDSEAQHVETSLLEVGTAWLPTQIVGYLAAGILPQRLGSTQSLISPFDGFPTTDGEVMIAAGTDPMFFRLCEALELPELTKQERFVGNRNRVANHKELYELIAASIHKRTTKEVCDLLNKADVPVSPVNNVEELVNDSQFQAMDLIQSVSFPGTPELKLLAPPISFNGERCRMETPPLFGADTEDLLHDVGYTDEVISQLEGKGVVKRLSD